MITQITETNGYDDGYNPDLRTSFSSPELIEDSTFEPITRTDYEATTLSDSGALEPIARTDYEAPGEAVDILVTDTAEPEGQSGIGSGDDVPMATTGQEVFEKGGKFYRPPPGSVDAMLKSLGLEGTPPWVWLFVGLAVFVALRK